jgi:outer membrane biosynthesis protein TonB
MFRSRALFVLPLLGAAFLAAGCGSSKQKLLTQREATRLEQTLEAARRAAEQGNCRQAAQLAAKGSTQAQNLPPHVDNALQRNLVQGFEHLRSRIDTECGAATPTPTPTPSPTPSPTPTVTPTPSPTPTETPTPTATPSETPLPVDTPTPTPASGGANGDGTSTGVPPAGQGQVG